MRPLAGAIFLAIVKHFPLFSAENYNFRISHFILERVLNEISHVIPIHPLFGGQKDWRKGVRWGDAPGVKNSANRFLFQ